MNTPDLHTAIGLTEAEWATCSDPIRLVARLRERVGGQKCLLLACAYLLDSPHVNLTGLGREIVECVRVNASRGSREACSPSALRAVLDAAFSGLFGGMPLLHNSWFNPAVANMLGPQRRLVAGFVARALGTGVGWSGVNFTSAAVEAHIRLATHRAVREHLTALNRQPPAVGVREAVLRMLPDEDREEFRAVPWRSSGVPGRILKRLQAIRARPRILEARAHMADLVRDIFGHPLRKPVIDPAWLQWNHGAVRHIAQQIATSGSFGDMPILADALEDAGCEDEELLRHCREGRTHVPGCWALDAVLGR